MKTDMVGTVKNCYRVRHLSAPLVTPKVNSVVTIKDVARLANVSIATVSRVVNNYAHVRPAVREAVTKAIAELGYRPNRSEEHTSELQSLMRTTYAVSCLNKKKIPKHHTL